MEEYKLDTRMATQRCIYKVGERILPRSYYYQKPITCAVSAIFTREERWLESPCDATRRTRRLCETGVNTDVRNSPRFFLVIVIDRVG